jgi:iron complex outermembrane receptor protein
MKTTYIVREMHKWQSILLLVLVNFTASIASFATDSTSTLLEEIVITEEGQKKTEYSFSPQIKTDTTLKQALQHASLSEYVKGVSSVFLRENGNGMSSAISIRGTQASHTQVTWNGVSINSQTMGQVDFNLIPMFFIDDAEIHTGGNSALHGNGAIGGAIALTSQSAINQPLKLNIQASAGSYKNLFGGGNLRVGNKHVGSKTAIFYHQIKNDFKYNFRDQKQTQQNAAIENYGVLEELDFKIGSKGQISTKFWHTNMHREIQPMKQNNNNPLKYETIHDRTSRLIAQYKLYTPTALFFGLGWLNDYQKYKEDVISTNDLTARLYAEHCWQWNKAGKLSSKAGGEFHYIKPEANAYKAGTQDWRGSIYLHNLWEIKQWIAISGNFRKDFVYQTKIPFTPSAGLRISPIFSDSLSINIIANISKNIKVPTLNDRFWGDIDNRTLTPEEAFNIEVGIQHTLEKNFYKSQSSIMVYRNNVDNWILWLPRGNIWKPINVDEVLAKGAEINFSQTFTKKRQQHTQTLSYSINHTEVMKGFREMQPFVGQQIPLLPSHTANFLASGKLTHITYVLQGSYVGERHTSDIFDRLPHYFLLSIQVGYDFALSKKKENTHGYLHHLNLSLRGNNILNTEYETMPYKAMPGRNFLVSLKWTTEKQIRK